MTTHATAALERKLSRQAEWKCGICLIHIEGTHWSGR